MYTQSYAEKSTFSASSIRSNSDAARLERIVRSASGVMSERQVPVGASPVVTNSASEPPSSRNRAR